MEGKKHFASSFPVGKEEIKKVLWISPPFIRRGGRAADGVVWIYPDERGNSTPAG
jgi:hypothetical protein